MPAVPQPHGTLDCHRVVPTMVAMALFVWVRCAAIELYDHALRAVSDVAISAATLSRLWLVALTLGESVRLLDIAPPPAFQR